MKNINEIFALKMYNSTDTLAPAKIRSIIKANEKDVLKLSVCEEEFISGVLKDNLEVRMIKITEKHAKEVCANYDVQYKENDFTYIPIPPKPIRRAQNDSYLIYYYIIVPKGFLKFLPAI